MAFAIFHPFLLMFKNDPCPCYDAHEHTSIESTVLQLMLTVAVSAVPEAD